MTHKEAEEGDSTEAEVEENTEAEETEAEETEAEETEDIRDSTIMMTRSRKNTLTRMKKPTKGVTSKAIIKREEENTEAEVVTINNEVKLRAL